MDASLSLVKSQIQLLALNAMLDAAVATDSAVIRTLLAAANDLMCEERIDPSAAADLQRCFEALTVTQ